MRKLLIGLLVVLNTPFAFANIPELYFTYSRINDFQCEMLSGYKVPAAWAEEAKKRIPEFQLKWDESSNDLFNTLFKLVGRDYSRSEMRVTLSVCKTISMSNPFVVNVRRYLQSFTPETDPAPMHAFVSVVFHEFLHNYIDENLDIDSSKVLKKYKHETARVRSHIHLMALQKAVYSKLNQTELLKWMDLNYKRMGGAYARSWEIVGTIEGHQTIVKDLTENLKE